MDMQRLCTQGMKVWKDTQTCSNLQDMKIPEHQRKEYEQKIQVILEQIHTFMERFPRNSELQKKWKNKGITTIDRWMKQEQLPILEKMDQETCELFQSITQSFLRDVRRFDPQLSLRDAMQALRNVWIIAILQVMFQKPVAYHPAMFAYSMLYPYTDNYLDDVTVSKDMKQSFNTWLSKRLRGELQSGRNAQEEKISNLVDMIEQVFDREQYFQVYESLYLIQQAQIDSLLQQDGDQRLSEIQLLEISYQKGGASVIADGFLIDGAMNEEQMNFCMQYGFMLQLGDDLQDLLSDLAHEHQTLMTHAYQRNQLEPLVKQLIQYTKDILKPNDVCQDQTLLDFVLQDCLFLIFLAAAQKEFPFSEAFQKEISDCLPTRQSSTLNWKFPYDDAQWWERIDVLLEM